MKLYVDTSNNKKTIVSLDDDRVEQATGIDKSQQVLSLINQTILKKGINLEDITEIEFNRGPGSFTGLKVGAAVANTLGWVLGIPVNGKNLEREGPVEPIYE
jgi:tRNA threonylcarbamoyladenosine biosynthesis protein TsaB